MAEGTWQKEAVCPTHVGMNRELTLGYRFAKCLPHTRGDEPYNVKGKLEIPYVCPTHVGMNRRICIGAPLTAEVCPTHVGMNRINACGRKRKRSVCPTHVGMNRMPLPAG